MQKNGWWDFFSPIVFFFFFSDMVDKFLWSVVLLLLYEAHARRNASQIPDDFLLYLFFSFLGGRGGWGFDWKMQVKVYDTKYVTVCTSCLLSVCHSLTLASDGRGNSSPKYSQSKSHEADDVHSFFNTWFPFVCWEMSQMCVWKCLFFSNVFPQLFFKPKIRCYGLLSISWDKQVYYWTGK